MLVAPCFKFLHLHPPLMSSTAVGIPLEIMKKMNGRVLAASYKIYVLNPSFTATVETKINSVKDATTSGMTESQREWTLSSLRAS